LSVYVVGDNSLAFHVLKSFGYQPIGAVSFSKEGLIHLGEGSRMSDDMISHLNYGASRGWLLIVLSEATVESENFWREIPTPSVTERVMFVLPRGIKLPETAPQIPSQLVVVETDSLESALTEAAQRMLTGGSDG
jgi:hypothetical protein